MTHQNLETSEMKVMQLVQELVQADTSGTAKLFSHQWMFSCSGSLLIEAYHLLIFFHVLVYLQMFELKDSVLTWEGAEATSH